MSLVSSFTRRASTLVAKRHFPAGAQVQRRCMGGHGGPMMPPFARLRPETAKHSEDIELVWDDSVAPETCIDFDAPHWSFQKSISFQAQRAW